MAEITSWKLMIKSMADMKLLTKWWNPPCLGGIGVIRLSGEDSGSFSMKSRGLPPLALSLSGTPPGIPLTVQRILRTKKKYFVKFFFYSKLLKQSMILNQSFELTWDMHAPKTTKYGLHFSLHHFHVFLHVTETLWENDI